MTLSIDILDGVQTKAYGDGMFADKNVIIGVFDENGVEKFRKNIVWTKDVFEEEIQIRFMMGKTYQMVLWAQYGNAYGDPVTMPLDQITLDYTASNQENLDAFYAYVPKFTVKQDFEKSVTLRRPFAQLNFATTVGDIDESIAATAVESKAKVTIANVANTLDLFTGQTTFVKDGHVETTPQTVVIPATAFPAKVNGKYPTITVEETTYEVISMNYVLVADSGAQDGKTTVDLKLEVGDLVIEVPNAYMKRNWRTNVVGELLTGEGTFTVKIDPIFDGSYNNNWNDGSNNENENPDQPDQPEVVYSEWKLLGSHNAWASEEFMVLEDGLAVARNVEFPATKAEGDGEFKVSNGTDWYGMPVAATVGADKYFVASKDNSQNVLVAPGKYDIWFDQAKATVYVMTPGKAIAEATEFKVETPEQPETESWGIVGTFNEWLADLAMTEVKIGEVDYWFADNFVVAEGDKFKFRYIDGNWDDANVFGAAVNVTVDAACELLHPGNDIAPTAGTYDIYLDAKNALVYVMTNGKTPADVVAPEKTNVEIYVVKAAECVNLYTWGAISTGTWPGKAADEVVTINAVDYYKWTLSVATTALGQEFWLIFNNGNGVQTADSDKYQLAQKMYFKVTDGAVVKIDEPH